MRECPISDYMFLLDGYCCYIEILPLSARALDATLILVHSYLVVSPTASSL